MAENLLMTPQATPAQLGLSINDIIDVICDDRDYCDPEMSQFVRGGTPSEAATNYSAVTTTASQPDPDIEQKKRATVQILEQPQPKALRFRYICEGRSAGSIPGVRSTAENKTYPTIKIVGYKGQAVVVVSCVTVESPHRPHPHNLVGKEGCNKGVCTMTIDNDLMECTFSNLGIQCVKKKDVEDALKQREDIRVDPYGTGFDHRYQPQTIDLNAVRLCFQVFLSNGKSGRFTHPLKPVVSDCIYDKKATSDLNICKLSDCTSCVTGDKEIILLCDKVTKEDIKIKFFETKDNHIEWEAYGDFSPADVHKQFAISFKTPKYKNIEIKNSVKCYIQLVRPSDKSTSEPRPFEYLPLDAGRPFMSFKRLRNNHGLFHRILGFDNPLELADDILPHKSAENNVVATPATKPSPPPSQSAVDRYRFPTQAVISQPSTSSSITYSNKLAITHPMETTSPSHLEHLPTSSSQHQQQSIDDIKQRMTASLDKKNSAQSPPPMTYHGNRNNTDLWEEDASLYSDNDILDEVLSQGSVNDLLSVVGEGLTVYEDVQALTQHGEVNPDAIDALYGDASYASCYTNLEFAMGRSKAFAQESGITTTNNANNINFSSPLSSTSSMPLLPPKKSISHVPNKMEYEDDDHGIYGTPSGRPIHPNKEALLRERGFLANAPPNESQISPAAHVDFENNMIYMPVSDIMEEDENSSKEVKDDQLPQTVLDLFV